MKLHRNYLSALAAALMAGVPLAACTQYGGLPLASTAGGSSDNDGDGGNITAAGHGSGDGSGGDSHGGSNDSAEESNEGPGQAKYSASLKPVQSKGPVTNVGGTATFTIANGQFTATVNATGLAPNEMQFQHVHTRSRCPRPSDDLNRDGYVDAVEEGVFSGEILIPLDADLSKQMDTETPVPGVTPAPTPGATPMAVSSDSELELQQRYPYPYPSPTPGKITGQFPSSDASGALNYEQTTDLRKMLADLRSPDPNRRDHIAKLGRFEPLMLGRRSVVIHGVPPTTQLPSTVRSIDGLPAYMTLPVACGEIEMVPGSDVGASPTPGATPVTPSPSATPEATPGPSPSPGATPFVF